ncbi:unnamed protein product [Lathyrus oleraceus]|nr:uncharacterized protein LOC127118203 [Pisum sativum]
MKTKRDDDCFDYLHFSPPKKSSKLDYYEMTTMEMEEDTPANVVPPLKQSDEDKSLVLYHHHPSNSNIPLLKSPTSPPLTIAVATHLIPGLKDYLLSRGTVKLEELGEDETRREKTSKDCLAVIPWVPNPLARKEIVPETCQTFEAEDSEMMDMDDPHANNNNREVEACGVSLPWQQQQCMMPNMLQPSFGTYLR